MQTAETFLISRTDSIGDVILTLPMAGILKKHFPDCKIVFMGRNYTKNVIQTSSFVDEFISFDELIHKSKPAQLEIIKNLHITTCIHVFPKKEVGILVKKAGVKNRIGTTNRAHHWLTCNKLVRLSRKNSDLHEAQLNLKLLKPLGIDKTFSFEEIEEAYGFKSKAVLPENIKQLIDPTKKNIILHAKSQGSGREWGLENFGRLIELLDTKKYAVFVSGTEKEKPLLQPLLDKYPQAIDITGKLNLAEFITFINNCDALVAASTGPLHIAAGFGKYAVGLFPSVRPMHPGRWAPLGKHAHVIMMKEDCENCKPKLNCVCGNNKEAEQVFVVLEKIGR